MFNGSYVKTPWFFKINNYQEIYLSSSNLIFPSNKSLKPKPNVNDALRSFEEFVHCTGSEEPNKSNGIYYPEFSGAAYTVQYVVLQQQINQCFLQEANVRYA